MDDNGNNGQGMTVGQFLWAAIIGILTALIAPIWVIWMLLLLAARVVMTNDRESCKKSNQTRVQRQASQDESLT